MILCLHRAFSLWFFALILSAWTGVSYAGAYKSGSEKCYGFPEVPSLRQNGRCVGLVADVARVPWKMPRKLLFADSQLYVTATGGWDSGEGQVWRLSLNGSDLSAELLFQQLDRSHGLRQGPDGKVYVGEATQIFRFSPENPQQVEIVIKDLPDRYIDRSGTVLPSNHPLTEFVFLQNGDLVVNVGAPSNDCSEEFQSFRACFQRDQQAELRIYHYNVADQSFDPKFKVLARGLRNSMGLLENPKTQELYQAENAADAPGTPDELNVISMADWFSGKTFDFGWPFCTGTGQRPRLYSSFRSFCSGRALTPLLNLPAHVAPLDMMYYSGRMFRDFRNFILMAWHGHRPSGSRIAAFKTNELGQPTDPQPSFLLENWRRDTKGGHPKGRPVGIAEDAAGAVFVADDVNGALLVIASTGLKNPNTSDSSAPQTTYTPKQLDEWIKIYPKLINENRCQECHGDVVKDTPSRTLTEILKEGWILPGTKLQSQPLWIRVLGRNGSRIMPPPPAESSLVRHPELLQSFEAFLGLFSTPVDAAR